MLGIILIVPAANAAPPDKLGVNLVDQGAFVNIINHTARYSKATGYDAQGWPTSDFELVLMDNRPATEWSGTIDDPEQYRIDCSGTYKSSFTGQAEISCYGSGATVENQIYDPQSHTTFFNLVVPGPPAAGHGFVYLTFTNTRKTKGSDLNTGISKLRVMRPGYENSYPLTFTDEYIALCKAANFACYRFYTVQNIWDGEPVFPQKTLWENRKTPDDACQQPMPNLNGKRDGWCWEYIIELANILKKDIWVCIHMSCDSAYVLSLAEMLKEKLDPGINIYIENSNEVWSPTQATHGPYNKAQADFYSITFDRNYARRTVELAELFSQVFGKEEINKRVRVILAGQQAYPGRNDIHLDYINKTFGAPKNYIYGLSTALYFGSANPNGTVQEINDGMVIDINSQINDNTKSTYRKTHIDKAAQWELPGGCTSYEGGPHLPAGGNLTNLANQINAHRTPQMKSIMKQNFAPGWFDIGGGLALQFTISSGYNRYGCWGLTDDYTKPDRNYKMQAMRELTGGTEEVEQTEILNNDISDILIMPNPVNGKAMLYFPQTTGNPESIELYLTNLLGQVVISPAVFTIDNSAGSISYDFGSLPCGSYILIARINGKVTGMVVVVQ